MLRYKHMRLDQDKIDRVKRILKVKTETEAMDKALESVIAADEERIRRRKVMRRMTQLRQSLGRIQEDSADWVRLAREERGLIHDRGD